MLTEKFEILSITRAALNLPDAYKKGVFSLSEIHTAKVEGFTKIVID